MNTPRKTEPGPLLSVLANAGTEQGQLTAAIYRASEHQHRHTQPVDRCRILALDAALKKLAEVNPRHARIVECRFFADMTIEETATAIGASPATIKRDWTLLRAWLAHQLGDRA